MKKSETLHPEVIERRPDQPNPLARFYNDPKWLKRYRRLLARDRKRYGIQVNARG